MEGDQNLLKSIVIETLIPEDGATSLSELLEDGSSSQARSEAGIVDVTKRDLLFIDERVRAVSLLQIDHCEEDALKGLLSRTEFNIETWAFDRSSGEERANSSVEPTKDLIYSTTIANIDDPILLVQQGDENGVHRGSLILAWEIDLVLHRPRVRMQDPTIYIQSIVAVSTSTYGNSEHESNLVPFKPLEPNILEPMQDLPAFENRPPYLAASRLERVRPATPKNHQQFRTEHVSSRYRIVPAVIARMRYTRVNTPAPPPAMIASLDIEVIPLTGLEGVLEKSEIKMANGKVEDLMPHALPMECRSRDWITLLYRLYPSRERLAVPSPATPGAPPNIDVLSVSIVARIKMSKTCQPLIQMEWTTNVDFFQALNPLFGAPSQPIQRNHRPSSLALGNGNNRASQTLGTSLQPVLNPANASDVTISFTASDSPVEVGKPFTWGVLVVNHSAKPTKLAVIPLPRVPRITSPTAHFTKRHAPKSSTASFQPAERRHARENDSDVDFVQAVVDENVVYAMQHSNSAPAGTELMALTAELRIGPLGPGQCHESAIEMIAFTTGTLNVEAVRVVDLLREADEGITAPGVMLDIRDLPDVVVNARESSA